MNFGRRTIDPGESQGCTTQESSAVTQVDRHGSLWGQANTGHLVCSSSTGLGAETEEELEDQILRDNRKNHTQMWPRDCILERNSIIQVDCDRERKRAKRGPSS